MGQKISIRDFAAERKVSYNAVTQFLYRRKKNNEKNGVKTEELTRQNGVKVLDEDSKLYQLLDEHYPKPPQKSVEVSQNERLIELHEKLDVLHEEFEREQELNKKLIAEVTQLQIIKKQLEDSTAEKDKAIAERDTYMQESAKAKSQADEANKRADRAEQRIEQMQNANLWSRIRKKW